MVANPKFAYTNVLQKPDMYKGLNTLDNTKFDDDSFQIRQSPKTTLNNRNSRLLRKKS